MQDVCVLWGAREAVPLPGTEYRKYARYMCMASFPGSSCAHKQKVEREEPGRIYHVKNVIGRELNVGERMSSPTLYGQSTVAIALWPTECYTNLYPMPNCGGTGSLLAAMRRHI